SSISAYQIRKAFQNIIQQRFTLNMLYPYIDEIKTTLNHEQLIEKLAQGKIDAETFKEQTHSLHQQSKPISSISAYQIRKAFQNIIQQRFTLNMLYPYIDEI
ncbi:hypothetical protein WCN65_15095, partial [Staphylococcus aureus]